MKRLVINCLCLCLSLMLIYVNGITTFASEAIKDEIYQPFSINEIQQKLKEINVKDNEEFADSNIQKSIIKDSKSLSSIQSQENQPPIA